MKRILLITIGIAGSFVASAQTLSREQIIGAWTCMEVSFTEKIGEAAAVEKTRRALINSQFIFRPNGLFYIHLPSGAPSEFRELEAMNNKMWHIKSKERMVFVGSLDEDMLTMRVRDANGFYYFTIRDTPMVLKMVRR
jgi:hypothetical protein